MNYILVDFSSWAFFFFSFLLITAKLHLMKMKEPVSFLIIMRGRCWLSLRNKHAVQLENNGSRSQRKQNVLLNFLAKYFTFPLHHPNSQLEVNIS